MDHIDIKKLAVAGGGCIWITASALVFFCVLTLGIEIGDGPGHELDNCVL